MHFVEYLVEDTDFYVALDFKTNIYVSTFESALYVFACILFLCVIG